MAGKIVADTLEHSTAGSVDTQYVVNGSAKAWLQYLQATPVVTDSFNISSVADNSTGDFTVNYTNAFDNSGHARSLMSNSGFYCGVQDRATTSTQLHNRSDASSLTDTGAYGAFHGDLA